METAKASSTGCWRKSREGAMLQPCGNANHTTYQHGDLGDGANGIVSPTGQWVKIVPKISLKMMGLSSINSTNARGFKHPALKTRMSSLLSGSTDCGIANLHLRVPSGEPRQSVLWLNIAGFRSKTHLAVPSSKLTWLVVWNIFYFPIYWE